MQRSCREINIECHPAFLVLMSMAFPDHPVLVISVYCGALLVSALEFIQRKLAPRLSLRTPDYVRR